ncbi:hypothetical protein [Micromonospora avicenniae]|uniref:hypothetical protein n=1 Tax=Micromonospora avicenniae TaxID=1198245 RepID=UPI00331A6591
MDIAQAKQALLNPDMGVGIGGPEYDHLFKYVSFLIAHDLARVDYDYFIRHWDQLAMVGRFIAPLTARGRELVDHIHELDAQWQEQANPSVEDSITLTDAQYLAVLNAWRLNELRPGLTQVPGIRVIQDKAFQGIYPFEVVRRVPVFEAFKRWYTDSRRNIDTAAT